MTPTLQQLNRQLKMVQYNLSRSDNGYNTTDSFYNARKNSSVSDDRSQILTWLSPLEPRLQHRRIQERRVGDIGGWLIQREEFKRWYGLGGESEGNNSVLFCYGDPGVGKTFAR